MQFYASSGDIYCEFIIISFNLLIIQFKLEFYRFVCFFKSYLSFRRKVFCCHLFVLLSLFVLSFSVVCLC